jgi:glycerophosphoryl diester phosphodiesterase
VGKVAIIAHRGASAYALENTLEAFKLARKQGADCFELDVRLCKTGEVVVMHDSTVERTTEGTGRIASMTAAQLRSLGVPTLREALKLAGPTFGCYVEIKGSHTPALRPPARGKRTSQFDRALGAALKGNETASLARAVLADVRTAGKGRQVVIQSFSAVACAIVAMEAPDMRVELLTPGQDQRQWNSAVRLAKFFGFAGVNTSLKTVTRARVSALRRTGLSCAVYTVNEPAEMKRLTGWGVAGIITDKPDVCRAVLRE